MNASPQGSELQQEVVPFRAGDGFACNLIHVRGPQPPTKGPVLLVHGAGVRANLFRAPVQTTLVDFLTAAGYDVWLENWRASIDLTPNPWTLDEAAVHDHPEAVKTIVRQTGSDTVKAVIHCQGSTSFMMSAVAGLVPQVKTIVSNAVSLHPVVPEVTKFKIRLSVPVLRLLTPYLDPQWGLYAPTLTAKAINSMVRLTHHECNNPVCKMVSFTYGTGFPALWSHQNLNDQTHEWIKQEFAKVPLTFFTQMVRCINEGHLIAVSGLKELPRDFVAQPPQTDARFAFLAGQNNLCFLPQSQVRTFEFFEAQRKNYHSLHVLPNYGHLDVFIGKDAARDNFALILAELDKAN
jgi:pimeloyl-ACP methyl ester carboxylesterase